MPAEVCEECRNLLLEAGKAILKHLRAVSSVEEAVIRAPAEDLAELEARALHAGMGRENAVRAYAEHRASHAEKAKTAASD